MLLGVGYLFFVGSNILLSMVVRQWIAILELVQEKMSPCPTLLSFHPVLAAFMKASVPPVSPALAVVCL